MYFLKIQPGSWKYLKRNINPHLLVGHFGKVSNLKRLQISFDKVRYLVD